MTDKEPGYARITRESLEDYRSKDTWGAWLKERQTVFLHPKQYDLWVKLGLIKTREDSNKWTDWLRKEYKKTGN